MVPVENLLQLLAHEEVRLEFVLFFQQDIPQLVQVFVIFETQFLSAPSTARLALLALINHEACELLQVRARADGSADRRRVAGRLLLPLPSDLLKVVPIHRHFSIII